jgi:hypothetical protein
MNLGHTENVSTQEASSWMDSILAKSGHRPPPTRAPLSLPRTAGGM